MNKKEQEILDILQEECAEVIQMVSKIRRFGLDEAHLKDGRTNREKLTEEIGDLLCMIDLSIRYDIVPDNKVYVARGAKEEKLKTWSNIFKDE